MGHPQTEGFETLGHRNPQADVDAIDDLIENHCDHLATAIEVGSWTGLTTLQLSDYFDRVYAVDHWLGGLDSLGSLADHYRREFGDDFIFRTFCKNMGVRLFRQVIPLVGLSNFWAPIWQACEMKADFIYIDADHRYGNVKHDIENWTPVVRKGGILAGNDYNSFECVNLAVEESGPFQKIGETVWWRRIE